MKTLYLPIHAPGAYYTRSLANKRGLRDALAVWGETREIDYLAIPRERLYETIYAEIASFEPDVLFLQLQGTDCLTPEDLRAFRRHFPNMALVNWNGDYWPEHLTSPDMIELVREADWQLVVNGSVLDTYAREGVKAAFFPFGYEPAPDYEQLDAPAYDVLFCGNNYSDKRQQLYDVLRSLPYNVGVYGIGWAQSEGDTNYDFAMTTALYNRAKIVISDNQFPDALGYMSDRPIQAMYAGAFVLQQRVSGMQDLLGFSIGKHYDDFGELSELSKGVPWWLTHSDDRAAAALEAQQFVLKNHSWDARVSVLFNELLPQVRERVT